MISASVCYQNVCVTLMYGPSCVNKFKLPVRSFQLLSQEWLNIMIYLLKNLMNCIPDTPRILFTDSEYTEK